MSRCLGCRKVLSKTEEWESTACIECGDGPLCAKCNLCEECEGSIEDDMMEWEGVGDD